MLTTPPPFPQVDSYALIELPGPDGGNVAHAVRIFRHEAQLGVAMVVVSLLGREAASGQRRIPTAELLDATPLSDAEQDEFDRLAARLTGQRRPRRAAIDRLEALRLRAIRAPILARQLARHEARQRQQKAAA